MAQMCRWLTLALLLVWPGGRSSGETSRPSLRLGEEGGVVVLAGGGLVGWNRSGQVQVMHENSSWGPVVRVTAAGEPEGALAILDAAAVNGRALLLAEDADREGPSSSRAALFDVDSAGHVRQVTDLPARHKFVAMPVWRGRLWVEDLDGEIHELLPDGQLGQRLSTTSAPSNVEVVPPRLIGGPAESPVFYVPPNSSEANSHPGYAYSDGRYKWRVSDSAVAPTICGDYLITVSSDGVTVVRSIRDARPLANWQAEREPLMACDGDQDVLVGRRTVTKLSLPQLTRRWAFRLKGGQARAIASVRGKVLVWTDQGAAMWLPPSATDLRR